MYSLRLSCGAEDVDLLSGELWDAGTVGIQELDSGATVILIASFETNHSRTELLDRFRPYSPEWTVDNNTDWIRTTQDSWPGRAVGDRLFVAPVWNVGATPPGRLRIIQNPGLACGTGEHPCTQLALIALERLVKPGCRVVDAGTGSGILSIAALRLGAATVIGIDTDRATLQAAKENFRLNGVDPLLAAGSADCIVENWSDVSVANISGTVLLSILDELIRITRANGWLILTGFPHHELATFEQMFPNAEISAIDEWRALAVKLS